MSKLPDIKAPSLPLATQEYSSSQQDQYSRALRLYFNTIDSDMNQIIADGGGHWISNPHIAAYDTTNQYATADNTPTLVLWNVLETAEGFVLNPSGSATAGYNGIYKIDYSLQLANTDNAQHDVIVWLRIDNVDVAGSATRFSLPQRKSAGVPTYICAYSSITFAIDAGQDIELYWATEKAYSTTGPVNGVYMPYIAAQTVPYAHPSIPSAVGSITFVSR